MKLVGRVPVEPLDDERMTHIERRIVTGAADAAVPARAPRRHVGFAMAAMAAVITGVIGWGLGGFWAHYILLRDPNPTLPKLLPILVIAVGCGLASAFLLALVFAVFMPQEESFDVSRDSLYGMTGKIIFAVDEMQGRIRIYDVHGTIHDEPCIIAPNHAPIPKGANAIVLDKDSKGRLIVEQVS